VGAFAIYLEPSHVDIFESSELRKNTRKEEVRARELFSTSRIPGEFMRRVDDKMWSLMCPTRRFYSTVSFIAVLSILTRIR